MSVLLDLQQTLPRAITIMTQFFGHSNKRPVREQVSLHLGCILRRDRVSVTSFSFDLGIVYFVDQLEE